MTYEIVSDRLPEVESALRRANRVAGRCGTAPVELRVVRRWEEPVRCVADGKVSETGWVVPCLEIEIVGDTPVIAGYEFVARIEHHDEANVIARSPLAEGVEVPERYRTARADCDHCQTNRRRLDTFVLRHTETGEYRQIGRTCLADYLRTSVDGLLALGRLASELSALTSGFAADLREGGGSGSRAHYCTRSLIARAIRAIRVQRRFTSKRAEREAHEANDFSVRSTANWVGWGMRPFQGGSREDWEALIPRDDDYDEADRVLAWIEDGDTDKKSDYVWNLFAACTASATTETTFGLVVSAPVAFRRATGRDVVSGEPLPERGGWLGEVGDRLVVRTRIVASRTIDTQYGRSTLVTFADEAGNLLKWFATGNKNFPSGVSVRLSGTVKKHDDYRGEKATMLTRCKIEEVRE